MLATHRIFDECLGPVRGVVVSSTYKVYYLPLVRPWRPLTTRDRSGEVVVAVEDEDHQRRTIVDGRVWLCGPEFRLARNARTSFEMTLRGIERLALL